MIKKKIKVDQVIDYLEKNPNFFLENSKILKNINFPLNSVEFYKDNRHVIQFKDWLIENLKKKQRNIIENARHNFLTQKKIHQSVLKILEKKSSKETFQYLTKILPQDFDLEVINIVTSNKSLSDKYNLIFAEKIVVDNLYGDEDQLIMDAADKQSGIFKGKSNSIYSNAIFSMKFEILNSKSLLVFGSKDKHFIDNRAYDLVLFLSNVIQEKLLQLLNK